MSLGLGGVRKFLFVLQKRQRNIFRLWTPAGPLPAITGAGEPSNCHRQTSLPPLPAFSPHGQPLQEEGYGHGTPEPGVGGPVSIQGRSALVHGQPMLLSAWAPRAGRLLRYPWHPQHTCLSGWKS